MPLDPEILAAVQEAIKTTVPAVVAEVIKPLADELEKVQYDNNKLVETINSIPAQFDQKLSALSPVAEYVENLKKQRELEEAEKPKKQTEAEKLLAQAKQDYDDQLTQIRKQLEERDREAQSLREADRKSRMRNNVLTQMRGIGNVRPNTEEDLLTLLEKRGLIIEDGDRFLVKSTDRFGGQVNAEFKDILPKMLESDFAHFAVPRGGTGTDGQPGNRAPQSSSYNFANMTAQEIYDSYSKDPEAMRAYNQILEQQFGKA